MASNRLGRYEIVRTLAKGAMTDLLLGRSTGMEGFEHYVALKVLRSELASQPTCFEAFVNEARLAAVLHHHNIVEVHDIGEDDGRPYFAMAYVHGVDLRTLLTRLAKHNAQLPLQHVVAISAAIAAALHHAHEQRGTGGKPLKLVHRDVSPGNVLVGFDGNVKVVDFGIAKAAINQIRTDVGVLKGQAPYMSPEQCAGKPVDRRSDVFALGTVLYELATVRRLFKGANDFLTMSAVCNAEVPKPSQYRRDIPVELEAIMLKALARNPDERFKTAGDMSLALDRVASTVGVGASTIALAHYMRSQFGEPKEPWLAPRKQTQDDEEDDFSDVTDVDFDGAASGLAPPPSEAVQKAAMPRVITASKNSPIAAARTHALTPPSAPTRQLPLPARRVNGATRPPPPLPRRVDALVLRAPTDINESITQVNEPPTNVRHADIDANFGGVIVRPSLMDQAVPPVVEHDASATAIVEPLDVVTTYPQRPRRSRRALWIALASMLLGGGTFAAVVLWPGFEMKSGAPTEIAVERAPEPQRPPEPERVPDPGPVPESDVASAEPSEAADTPTSGMQMTMADYERARAAAAVANDAAVETIETEPKPAAEKAPVAENVPKDPAAKKKPEPSTAKVDLQVKKVAPTKRTTTKTPPKRTAKVAAKTAKKPPMNRASAKKPTWHPDDLFLEDK